MGAAATIDDVLAKLDHVQGGNGQWSARCPHHLDAQNSLSVGIGGDGKLLLCCHAGCDFEDILADLELEGRGIAPATNGNHKADAGRAPNAEELRQLGEYMSAAGASLAADNEIGVEARAYVERRFGLSVDDAIAIGLGVDGGSTAKGRPRFLSNLGGHGRHLVVPMADPAGRVVGCQARALGESQTRWRSPIGNLRDEEKVNWSRLAFFAMDSPDPVFVCEGMSDPLTAVGAGYAAVGIRGATLSRGRALVDELATALAGRAVVLAGDADAAGIDFTKQLGKGLTAAGLEVTTIEISPAHKDLTGWHEAVGHESFLSDVEAALAAAAPVLPPDEPPGPPGPGGDDEGRPSAPPRHMTDLGNAKRLVDHYGGQLRYVPHWKSWLAWDGRRWKRDAIGYVHQYAKKVVVAMHIEAAVDEDKVLKKHAIRSEGERALRAMVQVASTEPGVPVDPGELDADPWMLNVLNGTIDLRTGQLLEHDPARLITKLAPVVYDPDATLPLWDSFLHTVTDGDEEMSGFLRRAAGYTLTGNTGEEKLFFTYGPTASGKSTFLDALDATMGEYSMTSDFKTFLERKFNDGPRSDVARLAGARLVKSLEVEQGSKLAVGLVKSIIGGDRQVARFLHANEFEFQPMFKLWLAANHAPKVGYADEAMWRRILRVPFSHSLPEAERDATVKETLKLPGVAGPAILAWAVKGCLEWQQRGLVVPGAVEKATQAYRDEQDLLKDFFDDVCIVVPDSEELWVSKDDLYEAYVDWARSAGISDRNRFSKRRLGDLMAEKNFDVYATRRIAGRSVRIWKGIAKSDSSVAALQGTLEGSDAASRATQRPARDTAATQANRTVSRAGEAVTSEDDVESGPRDTATQSARGTDIHAGARPRISEDTGDCVAAPSVSRAADDELCVGCGSDEIWARCSTCQVPLCRPCAGPHGEDHLRQEQPDLFDDDGNFRGGGEQ